jgi:hypothetical protein
MCISGIWPLIHIRSFEAVSGPKTDRWLVKAVTSLITVIGFVIGSAGMRNRMTPEVVGLAIGCSATLATVDVVYVSRGRISRVYLLDALAEVLLIGGWILRGLRRSRA